MCGIAGVIGTSEAQVRMDLERMLAAERHRGPDGEGTILLTAGPLRLGLGHRRLAILDLSETGKQPMHEPSSGNWLSYNGELYNFKDLRNELRAEGFEFRGTSDTEVVMASYAKWGTSCFSRFAGMYALALWDARRSTLVLARDPLGIKPLHYFLRGTTFSFASELRALRAASTNGSSVDRRTLAAWLAYGAVPQPDSLLEGAYQLEPGTYSEVNLAEGQLPAGKTLQAVRHWNFPSPREVGFAQAKEEIRATLETSVRDHLVSDVPVGVLLSAGIDSTVMAALSARAHRGLVRTFTVTFSGQGSLDEGPLAARTAKRLGTEHQEIALQPDEIVSQARAWFASIDQPSVDGLNTFIVSHAVRSAGVVVALSGLGGDELFGGYPSFRQLPKLLRWARRANFAPPSLRALAARGLLARFTETQREKGGELASATPDLEHFALRRRRLMSDRELRDFGFSRRTLGLDEDFLSASAEPKRDVRQGDLLASLRILEARFYMENTLLHDSDAFSMAHSLELRVPMLDRRVIDLAFSYPGAFCVQPRSPNKPLLVEAARDLLTDEVTNGPKRGFSLPYAAWMLGPLRELFEERVAAVARSGLLEGRAVNAVWARFLREPDSPAWSRAWALGVLGQWLSSQAVPRAPNSFA